MEVGECGEKEVRIGLLVVVPHDVQHGEHDVETVGDVQSHQDVVEADSLLVEKDDNREEVTDDAEGPEAEHDGPDEGGVGLEVLMVDEGQVLGRVVTAVLVIVHWKTLALVPWRSPAEVTILYWPKNIHPIFP